MFRKNKILTLMVFALSNGNFPAISEDTIPSIDMRCVKACNSEYKFCAQQERSSRIPGGETCDDRLKTCTDKCRKQ